MTFPSGAPGGYPGQGRQQPPPGPGYGPPAGGGTKLSLPQILALVTAGLACSTCSSVSRRSSGSASTRELVGWVPGLLFIGGLLSLPAVLPGENKSGEDKKAGILPRRRYRRCHPGFPLHGLQ